MRKEQITVTNNAENKDLEGKGMKQRFIHFKKRMVPAVSGALMGVMLMSTTCFAAGTGTSAVTQPLENLKTLIIAVIGAVGVIILAKNVMEFAQAYQQQDSSTMNSALKGIVAGVMMALAIVVCNAFINAGLPAFTGSYADWAQTLIYLCEMTFTIAMTVGSVKGAQTLRHLDYRRRQKWIMKRNRLLIIQV